MIATLLALISLPPSATTFQPDSRGRRRRGQAPPQYSPGHERARARWRGILPSPDGNSVIFQAGRSPARVITRSTPSTWPPGRSRSWSALARANARARIIILMGNRSSSPRPTSTQRCRSEARGRSRADPPTACSTVVAGTSIRRWISSARISTARISSD